MEVRIGVQNVAREVAFESNQSVAEVETAVTSALADGSVLNLLDDKGRRFLVPAAHIGYVNIGEQEKSRVGFGG
ncbi:MAG: DUF3107 domain-containing protein [Actinomycetota bacterium]|nr:DUF3107 domain-containing protein [Actinomycetota bacterium]